MTWILLVLFFAQGSVPTMPAVFQTQSQCEAAAKWVNSFDETPYRSTYSPKAKCFPSGVRP